jgi:hypothetical protein
MTQGEGGRLGRSAWALLLASWATWKASTGIRENDTFWHLGLGRAVLREGARVVTEPWALPDFPAHCVVPEWLWDVTTYALFQLGGYTALNAFMLALAALVPIVLCLALWRAHPEAGFGGFALVSVLCTVAVSARFSERPDVLALSFVALTIYLAERQAVGAELSRAQGVLAVLVTLLWAQVHGTFVLAPCIFGAYFVGGIVTGVRRPYLRGDALWLGLMLLACLTSAHGVYALGYVLEHTRGDAVKHIVDMNAPSWAQLNPRVFLFLPLSLSLFALGALGALLSRGVHVGRFLLALGGLCIAYTALRGTVLLALLSAPWALDGAVELGVWWHRERAPRLRGFVRALVPLVLLWWLSTEINERYGPLFRFGLQKGNFPVAAATWLRRAPKGTRALTSYAAGAYLGYALDGRVRTFVDSRTPMYFDDLDYALSRDILGAPDNVARAVHRYGFDVAVIRRDLPGCETVLHSGLFEPVLIEPRHTLFVRKGASLEAAPITTLHPCGMAFVNERSCSDEQAAEADAGKVAEFDVKFAGFLRLERAVTCRLPLLDVVAFAPNEEDAIGYEDERRLVLAQALLAGEQFAGAADLLREMAEAGYEPAVRLSLRALKAQNDSVGVVALLSGAANEMDDAMPPDLRAELGLACITTGDLACARFHTMRAAARGSKRALPALEALVQRDTPSGKREAAAWIAALKER